MNYQVKTIIIGGGQAGLSASYYLSQLDHENVVFEQATQADHAWRDDRWDSFTLVTPNSLFRLPGAEYDGPAPHDFMPKSEIISRFEQYIDRYQLPVKYRTRVIAVDRNEQGLGFRVNTEDATWVAENVVIATGLFQHPRIPGVAKELTPTITQLASGQYQNPDTLPPGAVLVIGSAQSGCQIAEELYLSGRQVYLCVSSAGRAPRRYRGKDVFDWLEMAGIMDRTVDQLESPQEKFEANPHLSGAGGGHSLNLHRFARDGVVLLGRLEGGSGSTIRLAPDLHDKLSIADNVEAEIAKLIDRYIEKEGIDAPPEQLPQFRAGYDAEIITELDLRAVGVTSVIWATGYRFDFSLVHLPVLDNDGYPLTKRGVTAFQGLYFIGMPWLYNQSSGLLCGVGNDAAHIATKIAGREL